MEKINKKSQKNFFLMTYLSARSKFILLNVITFFSLLHNPLFADEKNITLNGNKLEIQAESAQIQIDTEQREDIRFQFLGDTNAINAIHTHTEGGQVTLKEMGKSSNSSIITSSNVQINGNVVVRGGNVSIGTINLPGDQNSTANSPKIHILAPRSLPLNIKSFGAKIAINKTDAPFKLEMLGYGDVEITALHDGEITLQGTGNLQIGHITGDLKIVSNGTGDIKVEHGEIHKLSIDLQGTGNIMIDGTSVDATIRSEGTGNIKIYDAQHVVIANHSGVGSIKIGRVEY
ncbi:MAG: DUF2807 domain-containing protein [Magnetococcus sp. DMHC-6]